METDPETSHVLSHRQAVAFPEISVLKASEDQERKCRNSINIEKKLSFPPLHQINTEVDNTEVM